MMRGFAFAALVAVLVPGLAAAQTQNTGLGRLDISGEAPSACLIASAPTTGGTNAAFVTASQSSAEVRIPNMIDLANGQAQASAINLALPIICNTSQHVVVHTAKGGLGREGTPAPAPGSRELVPYNITASWAGTTVTGSSQAPQPLSINASGGAAGSLSININVPAGGAPLVAGAYSDELIIELQVAS
jgi:hypothetical protein